jgi:hypothetical protein
MLSQPVQLLGMGSNGHDEHRSRGLAAWIDSARQKFGADVLRAWARSREGEKIPPRLPLSPNYMT